MFELETFKNDDLTTLLVEDQISPEREEYEYLVGEDSD